MPIDPLPDPIPPTASYSFDVQMPIGTHVFNAPSIAIQWDPMYDGDPAGYDEADATAQDLADRLAAIPGATVSVYKNRVISQAITPTE